MKQPPVGTLVTVTIGGIAHDGEVIESRPNAITCRVRTPAGLHVWTFDKHGKHPTGHTMRVAKRARGVRVAGAR
jgi:hypothetical protein